MSCWTFREPRRRWPGTLLLLAGADITGDLEEDILANFVIDGFADNRLPSPDQISQIIVDPNSLSADGDGRPRIEIVTRPGAAVAPVGGLRFADESLNALRPGESRKEPRQTRNVEVEVQGPVVPNVLEMSFQLATGADDRAGNSLHAITASGDIFKGVVQPERDREVEIGAELQINTRHRLDTQFTFGTWRSTNGGVGGFQPARAWLGRAEHRLEVPRQRADVLRGHDQQRQVPDRPGELEGSARA